MAYELCAKFGFCGSAHTGRMVRVTDFIPDSGSVTADQFIEWLLLADGYDPAKQGEAFRHFKTVLHGVFVKHMGADIVDASLLRYSATG